MNLEGESGAGGISQALLFPGCAEMNPIEYINGLAKAFTEKYGGKIYEQSRVTKIEGKKVSPVSDAGAFVSRFFLS